MKVTLKCKCYEKNNFLVTCCNDKNVQQINPKLSSLQRIYFYLGVVWGSGNSKWIQIDGLASGCRDWHSSVFQCQRYKKASENKGGLLGFVFGKGKLLHPYTIGQKNHMDKPKSRCRDKHCLKMNLWKEKVQGR